MDQQNRKRLMPWIYIVTVALVCMFGWHKMHPAPDSSNKDAAIDPALREGVTVVFSQDGYACQTPESSAQATAFQVVGAQDKLRGLTDRNECISVLAQDQFKLVAVKGKLAQLTEAGVLSTHTYWAPARDLIALVR